MIGLNSYTFDVFSYELVKLHMLNSYGFKRCIGSQRATQSLYK